MGPAIQQRISVLGAAYALSLSNIPVMEVLNHTGRLNIVHRDYSPNRTQASCRWAGSHG